MRNAQIMNDYSEMEHGMACLTEAYSRSDGGRRLKALFDEAHNGLSERIEAEFNRWFPEFRDRTFLTSLSEHDGDEEDRLGRLSMWRAYSNGSGVALVLNNSPFIANTDRLKAYSSPVAYLNVKAFVAEFSEWVDRLDEHRRVLSLLAPDELIELFVNIFRFSVLCTKHEGFAEEREWRVIYSPTYEASPVIRKSYAIVRDVPQEVYEIPLLNDPDNGLHSADIPSILNRLIIGPTAYPMTLHQTFASLLADAGVQNPTERLWVSEIPLRTF